MVVTFDSLRDNNRETGKIFKKTKAYYVSPHKHAMDKYPPKLGRRGKKNVCY